MSRNRNFKDIPCYETCFTCRNQHLAGCWTPNARASSSMPLMFLIGVCFIPVGIGLLATSDKIKERVVEYSNHSNCQPCKLRLEHNMKKGIRRSCNCTIDINLRTKWSGDVYFLYGLTNFHQNDLNYARSRDPYQLSGRRLSNITTSGSCDEYSYNSDGSVYAPCGAAANSMFSDSFQLISVNYGKVPMTHQGITWKSDREVNFRNPSGDLKKTFRYFNRPKYWERRLENLDLENEDNNGFRNNDLIVWMRLAAFPSFRKLYRKLLRAGGSGKFANGLPDGDYKLVINYRFPVESFGGSKIFVMTQTSWMGGKSSSFGIAYLVVGTVCVMFGFVLLVFNMYDHRRHEALSQSES